jgi:hypothetical protein
MRACLSSFAIAVLAGGTAAAQTYPYRPPPPPPTFRAMPSFPMQRAPVPQQPYFARPYQQPVTPPPPVAQNWQSRLNFNNAAASNGYIYPKNSNLTYAGQQQCAVLVQALVPIVGLTGSWSAHGPPVGAANPTLTPGTPIATLVNNQYPSSGYFNPALGTQGEAHSGIFLGYVQNGNSIVGMNMLSQSAGNPAGVQQRLFQNEIYNYYPIQ